MIVLVFLLCTATIAVYLYLKHHFNYWKRRDVPNPPVNLLFGNFGEAVTLTKSLGQIVTEIYNKYENYAYVGYYKIQKPAILLRDPELIKSVLLKDFSSFHDNDFEVDEKTDFIMGKNPIALKGEKWKVVRNQLTPCFTNKKIKSVFPLLLETSSKFVVYVNKQIDVIGKNGIDAKELMSKYTTENVASCAFGLKGNCFDDDKAEFREIGRKLLQPSLWLGIQHFVVMVFPSLAKVLKVGFFATDVTNRLTSIVCKTLEYRKENNIVRNDYIDILNELKTKHGDYEFTNADIVAHASGFFADGFESSSIVLTFIMYELAASPQVQSRLREEIDRILESNEGKFTYELIQEMKFLECVFWEGMRKHPVMYMLLKVCTKPFTFPPALINSNGKNVRIEPGIPIWIPVAGLHADKNYFPDPEEFDPDRFSEENRSNIVNGTFLGFGDGPRACLGQNFGIMQVKLGVATLVQNFEIRLNKKTKSPLELDPKFFMRSALGGIWFDIYKRTN